MHAFALGKRHQLAIKILCRIRERREDHNLANGITCPVRRRSAELFAQDFLEFSQLGVTIRRHFEGIVLQLFQSRAVCPKRFSPAVNVHVRKIVFERTADLKGLFQFLIALGFLGKIDLGQCFGLTLLKGLNVSQPGLNPLAQPSHRDSERID